jgi:hypothetical protein
VTDPLSDPAKPLSEEYLRAVLARVDQATPEPWESREPPRGPMVEDADNRIADFSWGDIGEAQSYLNAEFCAAARTDVPALARECLRLGNCWPRRRRPNRKFASPEP